MEETELIISASQVEHTKSTVSVSSSAELTRVLVDRCMAFVDTIDIRNIYINEKENESFSINIYGSKKKEILED